MAMTARERVLGVDQSKGGWIGVALDDTGTSAYVARHIAHLMSHAEHDGPVAMVGIDMPIALPDHVAKEGGPAGAEGHRCALAIGVPHPSQRSARKGYPPSR
jgi:predicted RNase H-like nuclease